MATLVRCRWKFLHWQNYFSLIKSTLWYNEYAVHMHICLWCWQNLLHKINCKHIHECVSRLTHWGRVSHTWVSNWTIMGSDNGLSPGRRQAVIWTNAGILFMEPLGINFIEILLGIPIFSFKKMRLKMSPAKWGPFCLGLNVLTMIIPPNTSWRTCTIWADVAAYVMMHSGYIPMIWYFSLTHWGRDKMAAIFQTTFSNVFSWMKIREFRLRFHWILFPRVKLTIMQHWFR